MLAFFLARPSLIALAVAAGLLGIQTLRLDHAKGDLTKLRAADAAALKAAEARQQAAEAISTDAQAQTAAERVQIVTRTKTLIQKVPVNVTAQDDARCAIGTGFVSVWNAAASGASELPRPAGGSEGSPSGVALSAVLSADVLNYGTAYQWRSEAQAWRDWYVKEAAIFNGKPK